MAIGYPGLERILSHLALPSSSGTLQITTAAAFSMQHYPQVNPGQPLLIALDSGGSVASVAPLLLMAYPPSHNVTLLHGEERLELELAQLGEYAGIASWLYLTPLTRFADYTALQNVVARLRAPDGCPWDRALTWEKLRASLLEETHELLAALDLDDATKVSEEQGDLLLQVALQVQIALEEGRYRLPDVIGAIVEKLVRRHPHVFGDAQVSGTEEVLANWEAIKRAERASKNEKASPLAGIPAGLPALAQAEAYLDRMSRLQEVTAPEAPWEPLVAATERTVTPEMVGEVLLGLVAWARARGIEAESALRMANASYASRVAE